MNFNPSAFVDNLKYRGEGMFGILAVMTVIIAVTMLLNYATNRKK